MYYKSIFKHHITSHHTFQDRLQLPSVAAYSNMYCCFPVLSYPVLLPRSEQQHQLSKKALSVLCEVTARLVSSKSKQVDTQPI
jgi:hypothetical protein